MYSGYLDYHDGSGHIYIQSLRLIPGSGDVRPALTTNLSSNTRKYGSWKWSGHASLKDDGSYTSAWLPSTQHGITGAPASLRFFITKQSDAELEVEGEWLEMGETYRFSGILERVTYNIPG